MSFTSKSVDPVGWIKIGRWKLLPTANRRRLTSVVLSVRCPIISGNFSTTGRSPESRCCPLAADWDHLPRKMVDPCGSQSHHGVLVLDDFGYDLVVLKYMILDDDAISWYMLYHAKWSKILDEILGTPHVGKPPKDKSFVWWTWEASTKCP